MDYKRVRVVTEAEIAGQHGAAGLLALYERMPSLRLLLALTFLYLPLWWLIGAATEFSGGLLLSPLLGLAASAAAYFLLRKLLTCYQYDPILAVLVMLLVGIAAFGLVHASAFGQQHRDDLLALGLLYTVALGVLFFRFGALMRRLISPVFVMVYVLLMLTLAAPLIAGTTRLLIRPFISRAMEVPLVQLQYFGGSQIGRIYAAVDEKNARAQCEVGRLARLSAADVLAGKPVPQDTRRASCQVMSPFQPSFVCPDAPALERVHASVLRACEDWARHLKS
jgi:hypothetical protein